MSTEPGKIALAVPTLDYVHVNFMLAMVDLVMKTKSRFSLIDARGSNICQNRNALVENARERGCEWLLFMDNDLSFPPIAADRLCNIATKENLDIIGCNYLMRLPPHRSMVVPKANKDQDVRGVVEVDALPTGMMMIRMSVFDKLKQPYFGYETATIEGAVTVGSEDYRFCDMARAAGLSIWMDTDLSLALVHWSGSIGVRWTTTEPGHEYLSAPLSYT